MKNYSKEDLLKSILEWRQNKIPWKTIWNQCKKFDPIKFKTPESVRAFFRYNEPMPEIIINGKWKSSTMPESYKEAYDRICKYIGRNKVKISSPKKVKDEKFLVIADPHIPKHNIEYITKIVEKHKDISTLVIAGDVLDCYSVSRFTKKEHIPLKQELAQGTALFDYLSSKFANIIVIDGNHTDRVRKHFETKIEPELMFLVNYDILQLLLTPYKNVHLIREKYVFDKGNGEATISHFTMLGKDCIVGHFETFSKVPMKAEINAYNWLYEWRKMFNIDQIRLVLQGHTHQLGKVPIRGGETFVGGLGCVAQVQPYTVEPKPTYMPHVLGYWIVVQKNGITQLNESNFYMD